MVKKEVLVAKSVDIFFVNVSSFSKKKQKDGKMFAFDVCLVL